MKFPHMPLKILLVVNIRQYNSEIVIRHVEFSHLEVVTEMETSE